MGSQSNPSLDTALGPRSGRVQDQSESHLGPAKEPRLGEILSRVQFRPKRQGQSEVLALERGDQNEILV